MNRAAWVVLGTVLLSMVAWAGTDRQVNPQVTIQQINGSPSYLGTLDSAAGSVNNSTASVPFTIPAGSQLLVQCSADAYVIAGTASSQTAAATSAVFVKASDRYYLLLQNTEAYLAMIPSSAGAMTCRVFRLR